MMQVPAKRPWESKTIWFSVIVLLIPFLEGVMDVVDLTGTQYAWIMTIVGVIIAILREVTKQPLSVTGRPTKPVEGTPYILILLFCAATLAACGPNGSAEDAEGVPEIHGDSAAILAPDSGEAED